VVDEKLITKDHRVNMYLHVRQIQARGEMRRPNCVKLAVPCMFFSRIINYCFDYQTRSVKDQQMNAYNYDYLCNQESRI